MLVVHLKSFGCKRLNLIESFWHGLCASLFFPLWPLFCVLWLLCFFYFFIFFYFFFLLYLGVALHYIHAFHSRCFFFLLYIYIYIYIYIKGKEKEAHYVLALFFLFLKTRLVNLFSRDMSLVLCLALMSLFIALD